MGNSESNTVNNSNRYIPPKSNLPPSIMRYKNHPIPYQYEQYDSEQCAPIAYPVQYPIGPNAIYPPHQFYPPYMQNAVPEEHIPERYHQHYHHHQDHQPRQHSHRRHHHHHHHQHHRSSSPFEPNNAMGPVYEEYPTMAHSFTPVPHPPPQPQPVSSFVTTKVLSPNIKKKPVPTAKNTTATSPRYTLPQASSPIPARRVETPQLITSNNRHPPSLPKKPHDFEKAPTLVTNYISKPLDTISVHKSGPDLLTVVRRSASPTSKSTNRWYDHAYDKRVQPLIINHL